MLKAKKSFVLADGAVCFEPFSVKFPDQQGKYRDLREFGQARKRFLTQKLSIPKRLSSRFPTPTEQGIIVTEQGI
jgi:hypothetical protein